MILQLLIQSITILLWLIVPLAVAAPPSMALPNCTAKCGDVNISYPFGIGERCYYNEWFAITCDVSLIPNKPFLSKFDLEVLAINITSVEFSWNPTVTLNSSIGAANSKCQGEEASALWRSTNFTGSPFRYSSSYNTFTVVGCDNALLRDSNGTTRAACTSECAPSNYTVNTTRCFGIDCCQTSIPAGLDSYNITITGKAQNCTKAFLAQSDWYSKDLSNPYAITAQAPVVMSWEPADLRGSYSNGKTPGYNCFTPITKGSDSGYYHCDCGWAYEGNPYIPNGCTVAEACSSCEKDCAQRQGGELYCKRSYKTEIILGNQRCTQW